MIDVQHYGANALALYDGKTTLYFSYNTVVAFRTGDQRFQTNQSFSRTTDKHLKLMRVNTWPVMDEEDFKTVVSQLQIQIQLPPAQ